MAIDLDRNSGFFNPWLEVWFGILTIYCCKLVKIFQSPITSWSTNLGASLISFRSGLRNCFSHGVLWRNEIQRNWDSNMNMINESIEEKVMFPNFFVFNLTQFSYPSIMLG